MSFSVTGFIQRVESKLDPDKRLTLSASEAYAIVNHIRTLEKIADERMAAMAQAKEEIRKLKSMFKPLGAR